MEWYKWSNLAIAQLKTTLWASWTSLIVETGQWELFPSTYPYFLKAEKLQADWSVLKREIVKVTNRTWDQFTIVRWAASCPSSDAATTQWVQQFQFDPADIISLVFVYEVVSDLQTEITSINTKISNYIASQTWILTTWVANAYVLTITTNDTNYVDGRTYYAKIHAANTSACTFNINWWGVKDLKKKNDQALVSGDLEASMIIAFGYNWTDWVLELLSTDAAPATVDINGQAEETTLWDNDEFIFYKSATWNKKIKKSNLAKEVFQKWKTLFFTKNLADATAATTVIAHWLWRVPFFAAIKGICNYTWAMYFSEGSYDGTNNRCQVIMYTTVWQSTAYAIKLDMATPNTNFQTWVITWDSTNITITWTKTWSPTGTVYGSIVVS